MQWTRRTFVRGSGLACIGLGIDPSFLVRALAARETQGSGRWRRILVCLFQRGAVDGLSVLVPHGEARYYEARPRLAIPRQETLDLDGHFGLHPALAPLLPLWRNGSLAIVPACGSPGATRSHFDAQEAMESGTPGQKSTRDGWLNRHCQEHEVREATPFRAVAFGAQLPRRLSGTSPSLVIQDLSGFGMRARREPVRDKLTSAFEALYREAATGVVAASAEEAFEAVRMLEQTDPSRYAPEHGAEYPNSRFGRTLLQIAQLIKSDLGLEIACADSGGWDTHVAQGAGSGQLADRLGEFGAALAAFSQDLGERMGEIVILTLSEFGRTVAENGSGGTDHGHGTTMLVLGGGVRGGIAGRWPGLNAEALFEGRDLEVSTDFRDLCGEVLARHLGARRLDAVFPGYSSEVERWPGVLRG